MMQFIRLTLTMVGLWLLLSGYFKAQLLVLGGLSVILVVYLAYRMRILEYRGQPLYFGIAHVLQYWAWLMVEIVRSNIDVTKRVWASQLDIQPGLRRVTATPSTDMGRVIYANSITLTPGTTAINFTPDDHVLVHALHEDSLQELEAGEMADRVKRVEQHIPTAQDNQ